MAQSSAMMENVVSPTLEALCHDLDMFINELSIGNATTTSTSTTTTATHDNSRDHYDQPHNMFGRDNTTPLSIERSLDESYYTHEREEEEEEEDSSPSYSPVLESYTKSNSFIDNSIGTATRTSSLSKPPKFKERIINETPPESPSFLRVGNEYFGSVSSRSNNNLSAAAARDEFMFTTRSSSLNRSASSGSGTPVISLGQIPPSSIPSSPLAFEISSANNNTIHKSIASQILQEEFPNHALFSFMTDKMVRAVTKLNERRKIFCTAEYPLSFTGEEALEIIQSFCPPGYDNSVYLGIAQSLLRCKPAFICPIPYSEKSIRKNKLYNSATELYTLVEETIEEGVHGIYTPFTQCYSTSCVPGQPGCYSSSCPNAIQTVSSNNNEFISLNRPVRPMVHAPSVLSSSSHDTALSRAWSATVSKETLKTIPDDEIKRQEAIHELIYTEDDYVRDLKILDVDFAQELLASQCIEASRKQAFHDKVLSNYKEILDIHDALYKELRDYQAQCQSNNINGIVDKVGDIFLRHLPRFMNAYLTYGPHVVIAEYEAKIEAETNMVFKHFIKAREQLAQCRRLPFRHFIILPVTRLQRYSLLLGAILKKTEDDNSDKEHLTNCVETIKNIAEKMDQGTLQTKNTLRIMEINARIRFKDGEEMMLQSLDLLAPNRKLIKEGILLRKYHLESAELHVFLFDHMLLLTREKKSLKKEGDVEYLVSKKPVPMDLLHVQEAMEGFAIGLRDMSTVGQTATTTTFGTSFPIALVHLGKNGYEHLLYAENATMRSEWKEKLVQAKAAKEAKDVAKRAFEIKSLSDTTFAGSVYQGQAQNHGKVVCTVPFMGTTGISMIAIGTQQGVWMGIEGDTTTVRQVLNITDVQQIAVLEDHHIFLVLSDKTLYAYALDALVPKDSSAASNYKKSQDDKPNQKIAQHISFFHSGVCNGRTIVVVMKKKGVDSNFKVLEPVTGDLRDPKNSKKFFSKSGMFSKMPSWFKSYMEFYIGTESYSIQFLKARVVVVCARGFEIINLEALNQNRNLPEPSNPDFGFMQQREDLKPLGMYRFKEQYYLLCYNQFSFMVDIHGNLARNYPLIEWEGAPQSVAFYYPYVIGFDSRFVEVRHVETNELVQVLAGTHMRCLQFMNNAIAPIIHGCMAHPFKPDFQYVYRLKGVFEPPL